MHIPSNGNLRGVSIIIITSFPVLLRYRLGSLTIF